MGQQLQEGGANQKRKARLVNQKHGNTTHSISLEIFYFFLVLLQFFGPYLVCGYLTCAI